MVSSYTEVSLVFDRYISDSLKKPTRRKHTLGKEIRHKISDFTNMRSISLKSLLSRIDTKQDLTFDVAEKSKSGFETVKQQYVVTYDRISEGNVERFSDVIKTSDH